MGQNNAQHLDGAVVGGEVGVPGLAAVGDLHGGAAVVTIRGVPHMLDPAVGKSNLNRSFNLQYIFTDTYHMSFKIQGVPKNWWS